MLDDADRFNSAAGNDDLARFLLANGARLLYKHLPGAPRMALSIFLPGGTQLDVVPGLSDVVDRLIASRLACARFWFRSMRPLPGSLAGRSRTF